MIVGFFGLARSWSCNQSSDIKGPELALRGTCGTTFKAQCESGSLAPRPAPETNVVKVPLFFDLRIFGTDSMFLHLLTTVTGHQSPVSDLWLLFAHLRGETRFRCAEDVTDRIQLTPVALMEGMAMAKTMFTEVENWEGRKLGGPRPWQTHGPVGTHHQTQTASSQSVTLTWVSSHQAESKQTGICRNLFLSAHSAFEPPGKLVFGSVKSGPTGRGPLGMGL